MEKFDPSETGRFRVSDIERALDEERGWRRVMSAWLWLVCLLILGLTLVLVMLGCHAEDSDRYAEAEETPLGYRVYWENQGLTSGGYATKEDVFNAFDLAMLDAAVYLGNTYEQDAQAVLDLPKQRRVYFILKDHFRFKATDGQTWATGQELGGYIIVAMHRKHSAPWGSSYPPAALPWTHVPGYAQVGIYWGQYDATDSFPALGHELGHLIFGPGFEH